MTYLASPVTYITQTHCLNSLKKHWGFVPDHIVNALFTASKPGCPHMAGLTPSTVYWEFHFSSGSQNPFRHRQRYSWPPYIWHLQQALIWQWFTAHALKIYIAPDAAMEQYNNNNSQDVNDGICPAEQVNRSAAWGTVGECFVPHLGVTVYSKQN